MRKILTILLCTILALSMLAGCSGIGSGAGSGGQDATQEEYVKRASAPGTHDIYGITFPVQDTYWSYMFNAGQLGSGEEWIDFEINCWLEDPDLPAEYETIERDGREFYYCEILEDTGGDIPMWSYVIIIPQPDEGKYIEIRSDFIEKKYKKKAKKFYESLVDGIRFTDDEGHVIRTDFISVDGIRIPADGLRPSQFFFRIMDVETMDGVVSIQIDFNDEAYEAGIGQTLAELKAKAEGKSEVEDYEDEDYGSPVTDCGPLEIDGVECGWYTRVDDWSPEESDMMPYLTHVIMVPIDELQTTAYFEYDFYADEEDLSIYDDCIRELDTQIHIEKQAGI